PGSASAAGADGAGSPGVTIDAANLTATAGAATPLAELHATLAARGFRPVLPGPSGDNPAFTVGKAVSDAAQRAAVRDSLLAVRATLVDGEPARFGSNAVKDVAGYDLKRLFIGSGPAFGTLHEVTLKVTPVRSGV
ncbi:MAG: FAD-binding oxidoreductase, partial [Chloroflexota bacterium]|nr:FAD-binding oxidoreductase [Chloroflexota bacterium]